jgi:hypothetical protein
MSCGWGNLYNFRQYYRLICCCLFTGLYKVFFDLSSLEIIDRTEYVHLLYVNAFNNPFYLDLMGNIEAEKWRLNKRISKIYDRYFLFR